MKHFLCISLILLVGCKKDDPAPTPNPPPAPIPVVTLNGHFEGLIDGNFVEFTQNVGGWYGEASHSFIDNLGIGETRYSFGLHTTQTNETISLTLGSIYWNIASGSSAPSLSNFNQFFLDNLTPLFTTDALDGCELSYTKADGTVWKSKENSGNIQEITFSQIVQESDSDGDYSKFNSTFSCYVYNASQTDSMLIQSGILQGWFER